MRWKRIVTILATLAMSATLGGFMIPENLSIPVSGATRADWNAKSFWFRPWGRSGVHRGIDIFAREGTPVTASCSGVVVFSGTLRDGGNAVAVLGPKWRVHYYAHLKSLKVTGGQFVTQGNEIGSVGTTGNAVGKPPHLHYSIITQFPYVWHLKIERFGFDRMFYLDPNEQLVKSAATSNLRFK